MAAVGHNRNTCRRGAGLYTTRVLTERSRLACVRSYLSKQEPVAARCRLLICYCPRNEGFESLTPFPLLPPQHLCATFLSITPMTRARGKYALSFSCERACCFIFRLGHRERGKRCCRDRFNLSCAFFEARGHVSGSCVNRLDVLYSMRLFAPIP